MEELQHKYYIEERSKRKRLIRKKNQLPEDAEKLFKQRCYEEYKNKIKNEPRDL